VPLTVTALEGLPRIQPGDDLAAILIAGLARGGLVPKRHDVLVIAQKAVSKAEGRYADLAAVTPTPRVQELAGITGKDARLVEIILSQTDGGLTLANAGIDQSNLAAEDRGRRVLLLPENPDASAQSIKARLDRHFQAELGVIISDSVGRPWRLGTVGLAIGAAGLPALWDRRGEPDLAGRPLEVTEVGFADAIAAAGVLVMGEAAEGRPAALIQGLDWSAEPRPASALLRPKREDLFR
jgi:coenzyme F420-0:L-glutamate ligase/coenzyme F420-1:gamma-L-glutamate ligase